MSLTKKISDKKVNFEFNKEFINWFHIEGFEQKYIYPLVPESAEPAQ